MLVQHLNIDALLPFLVQQHLLTDQERKVLLNEILTHSLKVMKLLHFVEMKGPEGFRRFLKAVANEKEHIGHREVEELFAASSKS